MSSPRPVHRWIFRAVLLMALIAILTAPPRTSAQAMHPHDDLASEAHSDPRLNIQRDSDLLDDSPVPVAADVLGAWSSFRVTSAVENPGEWVAWVDRRTGRLEYAEGAGLAWLPGHGNELNVKDLESRWGKGAKADLPTLEKMARRFLEPLSGALGVDPRDLVLSAGRSGPQSDYLWYVDFDVVHAGLPIDGARVFFRINNGNLIQFGTEGLGAPGIETKVATLDRARAEAIAGAAFPQTAKVDRIFSATLVLVPLALDLPGRFGVYENGRGVELVPVWDIAVERKGTPWRARIDATSGAVLALEDLRQFGAAQVHGGVRFDATVGEADLPFPFADVSGAGTTNSAGIYNFTSGTPSSTLGSTFVAIADNCGSISQSSDAAGEIDFLTSGGSDCTTPGSGGSGNTASARTQFYWVNRAMEMGRGWLPANNFLNSQLPVNVNISKTCNAYWHPLFQDLNFFVSGPAASNPSIVCGNTGELPGVSLHEFGHGLDQFDGIASPDKASGESYADIVALLLTHNSCTGNGFFVGQPCFGYGDACTSCTGIRDIDWAQREDNTPHTVANFVQPNCPDENAGICGTEEHCESYIATESFWDFVQRDFPGAGSAQAWSTAERLWYLSRPTASKAWKCIKSNPTWSSNGCASGSMFRVLRAADDDDGNLANGTPRGGAIFAALNRHEIACVDDARASTTFVGCTPPAIPTLTVTAGTNQNFLSWTTSGAGKVYDIYRSENGCNSGFTKIKDNHSTLSFTDNAVASNSQYAYQVVAHPTGNESCSAAPTSCQVVTGLEPTDLWAKDKTWDTGLEPDPATAANNMWESRDIWVRTVDDGKTWHQNPEQGQTNFVNVRFYNKGTVAAKNVTVMLYGAVAAAGLDWPVAWTQLGTAVTDIDANGETIVVIPWIPGIKGHYCLFARILSAQDPLPAQVADMNVNVRNSNNLVWRNVNVVNLVGFSAFGAGMILSNIDTGAAEVKVSFHDRIDEGVINPFLRRGRITVDLGTGLFDLWRRSGMRGDNVSIAAGTSIQILGDGAWIQLSMSGREKGTISLRFEDTATGTLQTRTEPNVFEVRQTNVRSGEVQGGVTYEIESPALR